MSDVINDPSLPDVDPARAASTPDVDWGEFNPNNDDPVVVAPSPASPPSEPVPTPTAPVAAPVAPPPPAVQAPAPAAPPAPQLMPPLEVPATPTAAPAASVPPAPVAQPAPPTPPAPSFEEQRAARMAALQERYAIPSDKIPELLTEPEKAIPALLAAAHDNALTEAAQMFVQAMPQMVQQVLESRANEDKARTAFYAAWPELQGNDAVVQRVGSFYRANVNANATPEEAIQRIGELAMTALGKTRAAQAPTTPAVPVQGFRPAGVGTPAGVAPSEDDNIFAKLTAEWEAEEKGL